MADVLACLSPNICALIAACCRIASPYDAPRAVYEVCRFAGECKQWHARREPMHKERPDDPLAWRFEAVYCNGLLQSRDDKPAFTMHTACDAFEIETQMWLKDGTLHRANGPAVRSRVIRGSVPSFMELNDGWWVNGKRVDPPQ